MKIDKKLKQEKCKYRIEKTNRNSFSLSHFLKTLEFVELLSFSFYISSILTVKDPPGSYSPTHSPNTFSRINEVLKAFDYLGN